jgi:beta-glucosidase
MREMNLKNFRFSLSWSRILPEGIGKVNRKGLDFYDRLIDECLQQGIDPWVTLYHWDLPHALELKGGWTNRDIEHWIMNYADICSAKFGDRIQHWMVLNEPMVFTGAGYFLGVHAPGRIGLSNFLASAHHAAICQSQGARVIRDNRPKAQIGTTFSCSYLEPATNSPKDQKATVRFDALLNRLFLEPSLGLGYPIGDLKFLSKIYKYFKPGDESLLPFDFDFIGIQNYTREIVSHSYLVPYLQAKLIKADKRKVKATLMNWEVYPESLYHMLKKYAAYDGIEKIIVTENGAAFPDHLIEGSVNDSERTDYLKSHIEQVLRARNEGVPVEGYFVWTLLDNFEWAEGYFPRFGLVYVNFKTQERMIKQSGNWYGNFLGGHEMF